jgi:hypothetical protein
LTVRAKTNIILADGRLIKRNGLVDDKLIPEHMRETVDAEDLAGRERQVMLVYGLGLMTSRVIA